MFQKANDKKSHLILNLLSWVDFLQPKYCVFENVRGFLQYNLNATQDGKYRVTGGVEMGGIKFVVRALLAMKYLSSFWPPFNSRAYLCVSAIKSALLCFKRLTMVPHKQEFGSSSLRLNSSVHFPCFQSRLMTFLGKMQWNSSFRTSGIQLFRSKPHQAWLLSSISLSMMQLVTWQDLIGIFLVSDNFSIETKSVTGRIQKDLMHQGEELRIQRMLN